MIRVIEDVENARLKTPPPPPPLPAGMREFQPSEAYEELQSEPEADPKTQIQPQTAADDPGIRGGGKRVTMRLADAVREKEAEEAAVTAEDYIPAVPAVGGKLEEGEACYARSPSDGLYYFGTIDWIGDSEASVLFFDDIDEALPFEKIYTVDAAVREMQCFANWNGRGNYFPAVIETMDEETVSVRYDEDPEITETLDYSMLRFAIR